MSLGVCDRQSKYKAIRSETRPAAGFCETVGVIVSARYASILRPACSGRQERVCRCRDAARGLILPVAQAAGSFSFFALSLQANAPV